MLDKHHYSLDMHLC